jgi:hypothetical protein
MVANCVCVQINTGEVTVIHAHAQPSSTQQEGQAISDEQGENKDTEENQQEFDFASMMNVYEHFGRDAESAASNKTNASDAVSTAAATAAAPRTAIQLLYVTTSIPAQAPSPEDGAGADTYTDVDNDVDIDNVDLDKLIADAEAQVEAAQQATSSTGTNGIKDNNDKYSRNKHCYARLLVLLEKNAKLAIKQRYVSLPTDVYNHNHQTTSIRPAVDNNSNDNVPVWAAEDADVLMSAHTQAFLKEGSELTHTYWADINGTLLQCT